MKLIQTANQIELQISNESDEKLFLEIAEAIQHGLNGRWLERISGLDQRYWDLEVEGAILTLHLEHYLGISLFAKIEAAKAESIHRHMERAQKLLAELR